VTVVWEVEGHITSALFPKLRRAKIKFVLLELGVVECPFRTVIFGAVVLTRLLVAKAKIDAL
jgi:hypothetical protein